MRHVGLAGGRLVTADSSDSSEEATFTLTEEPCDDERTITVTSIEGALDVVARRIAQWPIAAALCDDVLRAFDADAPTGTGVVTESLAYSTLQSGPEFTRWLRDRGPATVPDIPDPVVAERDGNTLHVRFNRLQRHNAFSTDARAALLEALEVGHLDPSITEVVLAGEGPSFCSGGDLAEFGTFTDPASAHSPAPAIARRWCSTRSPADSVRRAGPRRMVRCWAAGWRWRAFVDGLLFSQIRYSDCPNWPSA
ncbi:MAG: hypothetical protein QOI01_2145 [Mycobacterium sp.]|nr:hypothetical protein [Mycobacterium sp.]